MAAKPKKCVALAFRKFYAGDKSKFVPFSDNKSYSAYDPQLVIKGQPVGFIVNPKQKDPFKQLHFKFLGTWIHWDLSKQLIKDKNRDIFLNDMDLVEKSNVSGFMKLWLYQFGVLLRLSWPFYAKISMRILL